MRGIGAIDILIAIPVIMPRKSIIDAAEALRRIVDTEPIMDVNISMPKILPGATDYDASEPLVFYKCKNTEQ